MLPGRHQHKITIDRQCAQLHPQTVLFFKPPGSPNAVPFWKYRVGDYRIVASIEDGALRILVVRIGNRKEVYRK